jgi:tetratricopeptide (TPR) repeat protein
MEPLVLKPRFTSRFLFLMIAALLMMGGCTSTEQKEMSDAKIEINRGHFRIALSHLEKIIIRNPQSEIGIEAAREAARICFFELKDFQKAALHYQQIVLSSKNSEERLAAQKQIVSVYFDQLSDYPKAVIEINKLVVMLTEPQDKMEYKMKLARAYYYQNNFTQAENETDEFIRTNPPREQKFDMIFLKGNISLAQKNLPTAVEVFKRLLTEFPERSAKDNVALTLSVCYEELRDFKSAIEVLEKLKGNHPVPEYIDIRINRLRERLKNLPASNGRVRK